MSSYVKPVKQCQDAPVGLQTVNAHSANQDAMKELFDLEHAAPPEAEETAPTTGDTAGNGVVLNEIDESRVISSGVHDTPKVSRGTMNVAELGLFAVGSNTLRLIGQTGCCRLGFVHIGVGSIFVPIDGLTEFYGEALPLSEDNTTYRIAQTSSQPDVTGTLQQGIYISLWEQATLDGGNLGFTLADFGFQLVVYGRRGEVYDPGAEGFPWFRWPRPQRPTWRPRSGVGFLEP